MTGVLLRRLGDTETDTQGRTPCDDSGRSWGDAATAVPPHPQVCSKTPQMLETAGGTQPGTYQVSPTRTFLRTTLTGKRGAVSAYRPQLIENRQRGQHRVTQATWLVSRRPRCSVLTVLATRGEATRPARRGEDAAAVTAGPPGPPDTGDRHRGGDATARPVRRPSERRLGDAGAERGRSVETPGGGTTHGHARTRQRDSRDFVRPRSLAPLTKL